jgi:hypothetical protein
MISALVLYIDGNDAGSGFYKHAQELGELPPGTLSSQVKEKFWIGQVKHSTPITASATMVLSRTSCPPKERPRLTLSIRTLMLCTGGSLGQGGEIGWLGGCRNTLWGYQGHYESSGDDGPDHRL